MFTRMSIVEVPAPTGFQKKTKLGGKTDVPRQTKPPKRPRFESNKADQVEREPLALGSVDELAGSFLPTTPPVVGINMHVIASYDANADMRMLAACLAELRLAVEAKAAQSETHGDDTYKTLSSIFLKVTPPCPEEISVLTGAEAMDAMAKRPISSSPVLVQGQQAYHWPRNCHSPTDDLLKRLGPETATIAVQIYYESKTVHEVRQRFAMNASTSES